MNVLCTCNLRPVSTRLVLMFSTVQYQNKIENLQKIAIRFLFEDYESSYNLCLIKAGKYFMKVNRLRALNVEIYKSLYDKSKLYQGSFLNLEKVIDQDVEKHSD